MDDIFAKIALNKIEEAINNGEFDNLPHGKPVNLDYLDGLSAEMRTPYTLLKNSGFVPQEVDLLNDIADLRSQLSSTPGEEDRKVLRQKLMDTELKYHLIMETTRKKR